MSYNVAGDLYTIISSFVHTNVTGLTADPNIRYVWAAEPSSFPSNGEIIIGREELVRNDYHGSYRTEIYNVDCKITYRNATSTTTDVVRGIAAEIDRLLRVNNASPTRSYWGDLIFRMQAYREHDVLECTVRMVKEFVSA